MISHEKLETIKNTIAQSGHSLHADVVSKLKEDSWKVLISPHYSDNFTDKPRELDIIAEKDFYCKNVMGRIIGTVRVRLFIECKYINSETVLWLDHKDKVGAGILISSQGLSNPNYSLEEQTKQHHYFTDESVVKLTSLIGKAKNEDREVVNQAINQSLNALIYFRGENEIFTSRSQMVTGKIRIIEYPIVVIKSYDKLYSTDLENVDNIRNVNREFQIEVNYAFLDKERRGKSEYFLIDMVSSSELVSFLKKNIEEKDVALFRKKIDLDDYSTQ